MTLTVNPDARTPLMFSLGRSEAPTSPEDARRQELSDDVTVEYVVSSQEGGSGGTEATLAGVLHVEDSRFSLECHHQAEPPRAPRPQQCLTYLATARLPSTQ